MMILAQTLVDGLASGSSYALLAVGFALVFSVSGILNVAHPSVMVLGAYAAGLAFDYWGFEQGEFGFTQFVAILLVGIVTGAIAGLLLHWLVLRWLTTTDKLPAFIATLGISNALDFGIARIWGARERAFPSLLPSQSLHIGGVQLQSAQLLQLMALITISAGLYWWIQRTSLGRDVRAVAESERAALLIGIRVGWVKLFALASGTAIAGLVGVLLATQDGVVSPFMGSEMSFRMFIIVLVAGMGSLVGPVVIGLGLGVLEALAVQYIGSLWQQFAGLIALIVVLLMRPQGVFGSASRTESA